MHTLQYTRYYLQHNYYNMSIFDTTIGLIAPHYCVGCSRPGAVFCKECAFGTTQLPSICYVCAKATKAHTPCSVHNGLQPLKHVYVAVSYEGVAKKLMHAYKFDCKQAASKNIAFVMDLWLPYLEQNSVLTWVPTLPKHVRQRGFDHTRMLAKDFGILRSLKPVATLDRVTSTSQVGANRAQRKAQLKNAFVIRDGAKINSKNIVLIDDVVTTGATIEACTKVLYAAGAASVSVVAFARTP